MRPAFAGIDAPVDFSVVRVCVTHAALNKIEHDLPRKLVYGSDATWGMLQDKADEEVVERFIRKAEPGYVLLAKCDIVEPRLRP